MLTKLPNLLTLARIALIPGLVGAFYIDGPLGNWTTLLIFVGASITDYFDGYFARSLGQVSALGRFLDPVADKLLVAAAILMLVALDRIAGITVLAAIVIVCREILISGLREFLAEIHVSLPVSNLAKWKTVLQMVAISFLLIGGAAPFHIPAAAIGAVGLWIAALLTLYTGYDYFRAGLQYVRRADTPSSKRKPVAPAKPTGQAG